LAFVRKKRVGDREYWQLVENYREGGKHRQRFLAHLGAYDSLDAAIHVADERYREWQAEDSIKADRARKIAERLENRIRDEYGNVLDRYHGGKLPTIEEFKEQRARLYLAPHTNEVVEEKMVFGTFRRWAYAEVETPPEVEEYRRAFGDVWESEHVQWYGTPYTYRGLQQFLRQLEDYHVYHKRAERLDRSGNARRRRLDKLKAARGD
jgi:hypothetical protein